MTVIVACVSDLHCGSTVGLCPPRIPLDDGGDYLASPAQRWLWQSWEDYWQRVAAVKKAHKGAKLYEVFNGDAVDGNHHGTTQIVSGSSTIQSAVLAASARVPLALKPDAIWVVRGTDAHVGPSASSEEKWADGLRRDKRPIVPNEDAGTASHWHVRLDIEGVRLDFAHHGRVGTRPWTRPNVVANLAAEIFYDHAAEGMPHPHLAVRSHMHQLVDTYDQHPTRVIQMPAWQLATSFIHRIAPGKLAHIGGIIIVIENGEYEVEKVRFRPQATRVWKSAR